VKAIVVRVGRGKAKWADQAVEEYVKRLRVGQLPLEEVRLPTTRFRGDVEAVRADEARRILALVKPRDRLVAVDERGESPSTEQLADWVDQSARAGTPRIVFAIGGPYGHGAAVRQRAWRCLSLSSMVTNHELARVFLAEQLYRVSTVLWGGQYHH
jgi:23S rRNA (pseudouridine1915-N3)-methyltransferase